MIFINPQPEPSPPIIKPREDETLQSWLARKNHTMLFHSWYPELRFNDGEFGAIIPRNEKH